MDEDWVCVKCRYYPPSACDGKPCCTCNPDDPLLNCFSIRDEFIQEE